MSKIVVAELVRLGKDGDKFSQKMIAKTERTNAKVDDEFIKEFNENWETSGRMYVINDKLTKERDESLNSEKVNKKPKKTDESLKQENEELKKQLDNLSKKDKEKEKEIKNPKK